MKRHCICCEKEIKASLASKKFNLDDPPDDAVYFTTVGNYGSTVFDDFGHSQLEIYVCDECLKKKANLIFHYEKETKTKITNLKLFSETLRKNKMASTQVPANRVKEAAQKAFEQIGAEREENRKRIVKNVIDGYNKTLDFFIITKFIFRKLDENYTDSFVEFHSNRYKLNKFIKLKKLIMLCDKVNDEALINITEEDMDLLKDYL